MSWILVIMMGSRYPIPTYAEVYTDQVSCAAALEKHSKGGAFANYSKFCVPVIKG